MRRSVPQYFPSRSEGGRDYAPSPVVFHNPSNSSNNNNNSEQPSQRHRHRQPAMIRDKRLAKILWKKNKDRNGKHDANHSNATPNTNAIITNANANTIDKNATPNWGERQDRVQHLGQDIRRNMKGLSKSTSLNRKNLPRVVSPVSTSASTSNTGADAADTARAIVDQDGFQIYAGPQPHHEVMFSTSNGFHSSTNSNTTTTSNSVSSQMASLVSPTEDHATQNQLFSTQRRYQKNQPQPQQQQQQKINNLQSFDRFHHQDGLDDSTVGTGLSRRHLLRDRANAFLEYASSVEQKHEKPNKRLQQQHDSSSAFSSPVSMLVKSKNRVKTLTKGFSPRKKTNSAKEKASVPGSKRGRTRRSEKIEKLMYQTMGKDDAAKYRIDADDNADVESIDLGMIGMGLSPIQHQKIHISQGLDSELEHVHDDLKRVESQRQGLKRQGGSKTRMVGQYTLSHESMRLDEAYHAEKVDRSSSIDSSKLGLGISNMPRRLSQMSMDSGIIGQNPFESVASTNRRPQELATPMIDRKRDINMDRYTSHDEMSPLIVKRQVSNQRPVSATSTRKPNRLPPIGGRESVSSIDIPDAHTGNISPQQANIKKVDDTAIPGEYIQCNMSCSTGSEPAASPESQGLNEYLTFNPDDGVAEASHAKSPPTKECHRTPTKDTVACHGGTFLDNSWQASPIQPAGSFAIFDDSRTEETEGSIVANNSLPTSITQQGRNISSSTREHNQHQSREQSEFMRVVAAIVIQTFFRRHLAYNLTWQRYSAVLKIQRFVHKTMERRHAKSVALKQLTYQFYDLAAVQIQAVWRGFWVRDCINVESYCASTIQKAFRSYWARLTYTVDLYRIIIVQSTVRTFLAKTRLKKQLDAATLIQAKWRVCSAKEKFMNSLADVLIAQSVCRRFLVKKRMENLRSKRSKFQRSQPMTDRNIMKNVPFSHSERTIKTGMAGRRLASSVLRQRRSPDLNQLNTDDLIRKWKARRKSLTHMAEC